MLQVLPARQVILDVLLNDASLDHGHKLGPEELRRHFPRQRLAHEAVVTANEALLEDLERDFLAERHVENLVPLCDFAMLSLRLLA